MEEKDRKQFKVTEDILAARGQRFLNLLIDYVGQIIMMFGVITLVAMISLSTGNNELLVFFEKMDVIARYTFVICIVLVYYNSLEILFAGTLGKLVTKTIVVDENGDKPNHQMILMRTLCRLIPFEIFSFIELPSRGWHDSLSKTYVVDKKALEEKKQLFYSPENKTTE